VAIGINATVLLITMMALGLLAWYMRRQYRLRRLTAGVNEELEESDELDREQELGMLRVKKLKSKYEHDLYDSSPGGLYEVPGNERQTQKNIRIAAGYEGYRGN